MSENVQWIVVIFQNSVQYTIILNAFQVRFSHTELWSTKLALQNAILKLKTRLITRRDFFELIGMTWHSFENKMATANYMYEGFKSSFNSQESSNAS